LHCGCEVSQSVLVVYPRTGCKTRTGTRSKKARIAMRSNGPQKQVLTQVCAAIWMCSYDVDLFIVVFFSYAVITPNRVALFVEDQQLDKSLSSSLNLGTDYVRSLPFFQPIKY
jgi:hypothetical protein